MYTTTGSLDSIKMFQTQSPPGEQLLQHDLNSLLIWNASPDLHFNSSKSCHLSINQSFPHHTP